MPSLYQVLHDLESVYMNETSSVKRYMILNEIEEKMKTLRSITINTMVDKDYTVNHHNLSKLRRIFSESSSVDLDEVTDLLQPESTLDDITWVLGMDSLDVVELIMYIEEEFNIEIDDNTTSEFVTINDILRAVEK
jgi:acyl carrier protein